MSRAVLLPSARRGQVPPAHLTSSCKVIADCVDLCGCGGALVYSKRPNHGAVHHVFKDEAQWRAEGRNRRTDAKLDTKLGRAEVWGAVLLQVGRRLSIPTTKR